MCSDLWITPAWLIVFGKCKASTGPNHIKQNISKIYYNGYDSSLDCMAHINTSIFIVLLLPKVRFRIAAYYEALTFAHSRFRP